MKTTGKKSKKKRLIAVIVAACVVIAGSGVGIYFVRKNKQAPEVTLSEVALGSVTQLFETTATISSSDTQNFEILDGVNVVSVDVAVGSVVNEGTLIATFDVSSLDSQLSSKYRAYENARSAYSEGLTASKTAEQSLPTLEKEIADLEKQIAEQEASAAQTTTQASDSATTTTAVPTTSGGILSYIGDLFGDSQISQLVNSLLGSGSTVAQINELISNLNSLQGLSSSDVSSMFGMDLSSLDSQTKLVQLQAQKVVYQAQMSETYLNTLQSAVDAKSAEYELYKTNYESLKNGWYANGYGVVSEINITAGSTYTQPKNSVLSGLDINSLISSLSGDFEMEDIVSMLMGTGATANIGISVVKYDGISAQISLGKYDMEQVKAGQKAIVTYIDREYEGVVDSIGAVASADNSVDISSMMSTLTGASGSSNAVKATVKINNPDDSLIVGFDADIAIITDSAENVVVIPAEAVRVIDNERCVYVYNSKTKKIEVRQVEIGLYDDTGYEIISGLEVGEQIVRTFKSSVSSLENGTRVRVAG